MTRSDLGVVALIYATSLLFLYLTLQLTPAAQIYPLCLISGLALLNTLYFIKCLYKLAKDRNLGSRLINDLPEIFKGFQPIQFFFVAATCVAYILCLYYLGFYLSSFIYLILVMWWLRVKWLQLCLTVVVMGCLIYGVFTLFLKVPLPKGIIFG